MEEPFISVVTPTLNRVELLRKNLESVRSQGYSRLEHIVVDGLSQDGTVELLREYEKLYNLRWISEKDSNHTAAVNKGFRMAEGDYICFLYSDEYLAPDALRAVAKFLKENPAIDILYGDSYQYFEDPSRPPRYMKYSNYDLSDLVYKGYQIPVAGALFRKTLLDRVGYLNEDLEYVAEHDFLVRAVKSGAKTYYFQNPLCYMLEHPRRKALLNVPASWRETKKVNFSHGAGYFSPFYLKFLANLYLRGPLDVLKKRSPRIYGALKKIVG